MIRAVVKNRTLEPVDPLPEDWEDGREVLLEVVDDGTDEWGHHWEELAAKMTPADMDRLNAALADADALAKEQVRKEMGLP